VTTDTDLVGSYIGKYKIEEKIGRGAMAEVFKARHPILDRQVAIKLLHVFLNDKTDILNRFQLEARNIAALAHPNIIQIHDFDREKDRYFMVMELIDGISLKQLIKDKQVAGKLMPLAESLRIASHVGNALAYAHARGVVHRDVKPANVLLDYDQRVVLADFGLARLTSSPQLTSTGAIIGTPAYMSPEQGIGQSGDARSDIYALGAMLYHLVTGQIPFNGETPVAIIYKHVNASLPSPRTINPDIPASLEAVILRAMEKSPDKRFQSAEDLVAALDHIETGDFPRREEPALRPAYYPVPGDAPDISLHVIETGKIMPLRHKHKYVIGRYDGDSTPDVDLTPFNAANKGVSRLHAEILISERREVLLLDLDSTNGTWINGEKASPGEPVPLHNGDLISFGKLVLQALIRQYHPGE
jgi:serine/threonine-protein kinase